MDMESYNQHVSVKIPQNWGFEISGYFAYLLKEFSVYESGVKYDEEYNSFSIKSTKGFLYHTYFAIQKSNWNMFNNY